ncbi:MAG: endonuclease MutS2 [Gemmatimonadota bacterium]|nr:MAG: endonuclease MutS2 [Gemmatimonadota bacterium]
MVNTTNESPVTDHRLPTTDYRITDHWLTKLNQHALDALEFDRVLEIVAAYATSEPGAEAVRALRPVPEAVTVAAALDAVDEMVGWLIRDESWAPPFIPGIGKPLERLAVEGSVWSEAELIGALRLLKGAREVRRALLPQSSEFTRLGALAAGLLKDEKLEKRLQESIDEDTETLKDSASPELKRLRRSIRSARSDLVRLLESIVAALPSRIAVPDASVTIRNGRYCIPVRREGRAELGGIVHDESASRATLFVEPPSAIEPMNHLRELHLSEAREVERILRELTDELRPRAAELADTLDRLVKLDSLFARGRYALKRGCARPQLVNRENDGYRVVHGRHPLLLESGEPLVPFDLLMNPGEYTLLVTGPNAGGKTVLIKAVGLIAAMAQSGILPPVGPGSAVAVFSGIFADIGDEQSIEASLSTFTAHLRNIQMILEQAEPDSLCLIDEIGGATDPAEGAALARAVLLELADRSCMTLATSHLGELNALSAEHRGIVNAGLAFDAERLQPLYRLIKGRPGRSYALAIAQRVGFPQDVLETARAALSEEEVDTARLLAELERKEAELDERIAALERKERELSQRTESLERGQEELAEQRRELEIEAHRKAREYLLEARKKLDEAMKADREAAREARRELEARLRDHAQALREAESGQPGAEETAAFEADDLVWITSLEREGRVVELRGSDVVVEMGGVKLQLAPGVLKRRGQPKRATERAAFYGGPELDARPEVDLRGMVAEEARLELIRALDAAVQAGLSELRVIHGKGTGVLRETVAEYARSDRRVKSHRLGASWEGGSGVTVLQLD